MRAEDPAVCMQLVDDDILKIPEVVRPLCVMRQYPGVEHVRICNDYMPLAARLPPFDGIGVAVIDKTVYLAIGEGGELSKLRELVLREGLCREEIEGARAGVLQDRVHDRQIIAKCLSRSRRRRDDAVDPRERALHRRALVRIERLHAAFFQRVYNARVERAETAEGSGVSRQLLYRGSFTAKVGDPAHEPLYGRFFFCKVVIQHDSA